MMNTSDRYLIKQLLFASFIATAVFTGPVILLSLFKQLPAGYIYTELLWPALSAIAPAIIYHVLPLLVAGAIIWCYGRFSSDGTLLTLHLAGHSIFRARAPALYVALGATLFGFVISCFVVPITAGNMHDVLNFVRHDVYPPMLTAGRPNEFEGGRLTIIFKKFVKKNEIAGVFIRMINSDGAEKAYYARRAVFERNPEKSHIVLFDGSYQEFKPKKGEVKSANFDQLVAPLRSFGVHTSRSGAPLADELTTPALLDGLFWQRGNAVLDAVTKRQWVHELVERISIPALTIIHTLLGLELLAMWGIISDRRNQPVAVACGIIASFHLIQIVLTIMIGFSLRWIWAAAGLASIELAVVFALRSLQPDWMEWSPKVFVLGMLDRVRAVPAPRLFRRPRSALTVRVVNSLRPSSLLSVAYSDARAARTKADRQLSGLID
jgi:lipopolysaccharide export system permease protein